DDAIVVLENIYRWIEEKGVKPFPAAIRATKEIGLAVLATTLSLMAVFLPVAFMGGIVGRFMASFGITMAFAIGVSMLVAFTLTPMMAARILPVPGPGGQHPKRSILERIVDRAYAPIEKGYVKVLAAALRHRALFIIFAVVPTCVATPFLAKQAGGGFLPENDEAQFDIYIRTAEGSSLDQTGVIAERIARETRRFPEVEHTLVTIDSDTKQLNVAHVYVRLVDPGKRAASQIETMDAVRARVLKPENLPEGTRASAQLVNDFSVGSGQNALIMYTLTGPDPERLEVYGRRAIELMKKIPGAVDVDSTIVPASPETALHIDRDRAPRLGVDPFDATATLSLLVGGAPISSYSEKGEQYDVFLRADPRYRASGAALQVLTVPSRTKGAVALTDVIDMKTGTGPASISRLNRTYQVMVLANVGAGFDQGGVDTQVKAILEGLHMPPGYVIGATGQSKEMGKMAKAFGFAFLMSFVFMYLVLAAQFESWSHPFVIMLALPMTLPFALLAIVATGGSLNIFSMLGLLVLFGVVKKNAILQVDFANHLRAQGVERDAAILEASRARLRPILMTTFAFVAGMLPMVFSSGIGAGFSKSIAGIVAGGQSLSLLLTLIAIPVIYSLFDSAGNNLKRFFRWVFRRGAPLDRGRADLDEAAA
ncbi:MAG: efflux RND transporter permease subunit, partial [Deltaproteobacteria bacterium]|nr:efflux RND transporter permease subunit [Deltaproteobacteria bacterium]